MGTRETYQETLLRACIVLGNEEALARELGVPEATVVSWLLDDEPLPPQVFLRAVDIVLESGDEQQVVEDTHAFLEELKRRVQANRPPA